MFFSAGQIADSVKRLEPINPFFGITFLVFKKGELPIGQKTDFPIDAANKAFLEKYYRPSPDSDYFFRIFRPSDKSHHWNRPDYAAKGLQSVNTGRFVNAFDHERNSKLWGWKPDYIDILEMHLGKTKVPILDLAVWLYREKDWPLGTVTQNVINAFKDEFKINEEEERKLFAYPLLLEALDPIRSFQSQKATWHELSELLDPDPPPDFKPEEGGILRSLMLQGVGPARTLSFEPAERLSLITGDNGLGKTFLLECVWWALTGNWAEQTAYPRSDSKRVEPKISFLIAGENKSRPTVGSYDRLSGIWTLPKKRPAIPGLVVYARVDGSFAVWDPMMNRHLLEEDGETVRTSRYLVLSREQIWKGSEKKIAGLLYDWVFWQLRSDKQSAFSTLQKILQRLSPKNFVLEPGTPVRVPGYEVEVPTLKHSYGEVPIVFESAGVRRIITLAYLLVWVWNEHKIYSEIARRPRVSNLVILMDEIEAHLHPQWQRSVLPALLEVGKDLEEGSEEWLQVQFMVATHSPFVAASVEPFFTQDKDKLLHLGLTSKGEVKLEELPFLKHGPIDSWTTSNVFGLLQARSEQAEDAIIAAIALQRKESPSTEEVREVSEELLNHLPSDDEFWPRWLYFAELNGVRL